ncbi:class I SAM-dependent methyltransferase [Kineococcus sp. SYSU DK001]|uniref:class I SAM-dependent methyltransferase n=1 Tax=Kineococcus sp. SYSU DK001 TaxID=3383122 RepID=UPI003D7EE878
MDDHERTRRAWAQAAGKYVREHERFLAQARTAELFAVERRVLAPVLAATPAVLHPMSGNGVDDVALVRAGAATVTGLDYDERAVAWAQRRADALGHPVRYVRADVPPFPVADGAFDLVYTGKGALVWVADLRGWAAEVARVLRPGGHLFVHESHPMVPLYSWDEDTTRIRADRDYFAAAHVNDSFPGFGAVERQHTFAAVVTSVLGAGLTIEVLEEHPEPFWRMGDVDAAAWRGRLPNSFSLLARLSG